MVKIMAGSLGNLNIQLSLEAVKFQQTLERSSRDTQRFVKQFQVNFANAQQKAKQFSERTTNYLNNIEQAAKNINSTTKWSFHFDNFSRIAGLANQFVKTADSYTELQNRMRLVTESTVQMVAATESVFDIALKTNQSLNATSEVYQRFAKNAKQLGLSQAEVASLTETVSKAVAMSGASAASAEAALMQFGQAMASGELRGEELNSVMEQTPGLADAIAKGLGITTAELKAMGKAGELAIPKVIEALKKAKDSVDSDFEKRVITVSQAFTNLETHMVKTIGELDKANGITGMFAKSIDFAANNLDSLIKVTGAFVAAGAVAYIGRYANGMLVSAYNTAKNTREHYSSVKATYDNIRAKRLEMQTMQAVLAEQYKAAQSERTQFALREQMKVQSQQIIALAKQEAQAKRELSVANSLVTKASGVLKGALGLLGGPTGAAMLAGSALFYFSMQAKEAQQKALDTASANERLRESYDGLSASALSLKIADQLKDLENYEKQITSVEAEISEIQTTHWQFGLELSEKSKKDLDLLRDKLQQIKENQDIDFSVLKNQVIQLGVLFLQSGKSTEDFARKLKLMGVDSKLINEALAELPNKLKNTTKETKTAEQAVLDLKKAQEALTKKSDDLRTKLEVLRLKNQGHAKASFVLAGLYDVLGEKGAKYSEVLNAIARGDVAAAESAAKAINLSAEQLKTMLAMGKEIGQLFSSDQETQTLEKELKVKAKGTKTDYVKQYTDQLTEMQNRIAQLRADTDDIKLFGEPSQYQEFNKLQQDITANAEKYAAYGVEGVAKLKEMARQIDSETQKKAIAQFGINNNKQLDAMEFELSLLGKTRKEQDLIQYNHQLDLEAARLKIGMSKENAAQLDAEIIKLKARRAEIERQKALAQSNPLLGLQDGIVKFGEAANNVMANVSQITQNALGGMSDVLTDFVLTGKANFNDLAQSIIKDISAMIMKMMVFKALESAFGGTSFGKLLGFSQGGLVGFDNGGFTGLGGKYTPAGIVHKGEYVITKEATSRLGVDYLNFLNYGTRRGFANGGGVAVPKVPMVKAKTQNANVSIKVINNGEPVDAKVTQKQQGEQLQVTVELMRKIAKQEASSMLQTNFRAGGAFA